jgi:hypothetical protein
VCGDSGNRGNIVFRLFRWFMSFLFGVNINLVCDCHLLKCGMGWMSLLVSDGVT